VTDYVVKAMTNLLYGEVPKAVDAQPDLNPLEIARSLTDQMTRDGCRVVLDQLVAQHVRTAQRRREAALHVSEESLAVSDEELSKWRR